MDFTPNSLRSPFTKLSLVFEIFICLCFLFAARVIPRQGFIALVIRPAIPVTAERSNRPMTNRPKGSDSPSAIP